jgi:anti-anti-sigma factor
MIILGLTLLRGVHGADLAWCQSAGSSGVTPEPPLKVEMDAGQGTVTVVVSGELDAAAVPWIAAELTRIAAHRPQRLVFDLTGLGFLDCAAARLIVGMPLPAGRRPVIRGARPVVRRILQVSGLAARCVLDDEPSGPGS